jgi:hypothetical protein
LRQPTKRRKALRYLDQFDVKVSTTDCRREWERERTALVDEVNRRLLQTGRKATFRVSLQRGALEGQLEAVGHNYSAMHVDDVRGLARELGIETELGDCPV